VARIGRAYAPRRPQLRRWDRTAPTLDVTSAVPTKISTVAGFNTSTIAFTVDEAIQAWMARVVPSTGSDRTAGSLIKSGGAAGAGTVTTTVKGADLETASAGDGAKLVKFFAQDVAGNWSS
jgi:uncharacterized membrane protein